MDEHVVADLRLGQQHERDILRHTRKLDLREQVFDFNDFGWNGQTHLKDLLNSEIYASVAERSIHSRLSLWERTGAERSEAPGAGRLYIL